MSYNCPDPTQCVEGPKRHDHQRLSSPPVYALIESAVSGAVWSGISTFLKYHDVKLSPGEQEALHRTIHSRVLAALAEEWGVGP